MGLEVLVLDGADERDGLLPHGGVRKCDLGGGGCHGASGYPTPTKYPACRPLSCGYTGLGRPSVFIVSRLIE
jgi:hypothetical protein